ncbi:MAG: sulfite exporter TauE/SafE family protein [Phycisphaeraceae bacterium]|nr:sulfite exporter TauE/SafE family protein [Phycisphaeraceae bacterium]
MDYLLVSITALLAAGLTFFSGFGLGTILMPAFALFFPIEVAIAATAVVHLANNLFKLALVGRQAHWPTVWRYGITAALAAAAGALTLEWLGAPRALAVYTIGERECRVTAVKVVIAVVIAAFALLEMSRGFERATFRPRWVWLGGLVSGYFGGLSGHQGALRSAFLLRLGLSKEQFIGTRVVGAVIVDVSRVSVYAIAAAMSARAGGGAVQALGEGGRWGLVVAATVCAFVGSFVGTRLVKSITMTGLRRFVGGMLLVLAAAIGVGLV